MAHLAKIGALTDELITLITSETATVRTLQPLSVCAEMLHASEDVLTAHSPMLRNSVFTKRALYGHYDIAITLERTNSKLLANLMVSRRSFESTMRTH
jgi:hypothetical protein